MPPSLASLFCLGFVLWLFRRNSATTPRLSKALWIPTIWVGIVASRPVGAWFAGDAAGSNFESYLDGSALDRNVFLVLMVAGVFALTRRQIDWRFFWSRNRWLVCYYLFCCISVLWAEYSFVAFKRWIKEVGTLIMILVILTEAFPVAAVRQVFLRCAFVLIPASILVIKYYLGIGRAYNEWTGAPMLSGVTTDKNALGRLCFVSALVLIWTLLERPESKRWIQHLRRRMPELLIFLLGIWLLKNADSSTSKGCFAVGIIAFGCVWSNWPRRHPGLAGAAGVSFLLLSSIFLSVPGCRGVVAESLNRRADLTDRTEIWSGSLALGTNPLIGAGYSSVWLTEDGRNLKTKLQMAHSHNGYLETYLNTGVIGLFLLLGIIGTAGVNAFRSVARGEEWGAIATALFFSCVIYNYTEVGFDNMSLVGFVIWLLAVRVRLLTPNYSDGELPDFEDAVAERSGRPVSP